MPGGDSAQPSNQHLIPCTRRCSCYWEDHQPSGVVGRDLTFGSKSEADAIFSDTQVKITSKGHPHLGAPLSSPEYVSKYVILKSDFIPNLTGCSPPNDIERKLMALPARLGGLGIGIPSQNSDDAFIASLLVTAPLRQLIHSNDTIYSYQALADQRSAKADIWRKRREQATSVVNNLRRELTPAFQKAMNLARERGSSSWLTAFPLEEHGFSLHKGAFIDALALRYGWVPSRSPTSCTCGANFTEHALSCPRGGFPSIRHNEIRDITANLLSEVCNDTRVEPDLQS